MSELKLRHVLVALATAAALAGCGGGGGGNDEVGAQADTASNSDVPATALQSVDGLMAYGKQLIASMTNETSEPVRLGDATLPKSDTTEASN